ncbi:MAG: hypothetical protein IPP88_18525 [Betaproteobacteria bacterium]|nr:hypothetical protein [Betaproteobacteria bacterium]
MIKNLGKKEKTNCGKSAIGALVLSSFFVCPAWAGRPLATEDAGVLGDRECEIESYAGQARESSSPNVNALWVQYGCGIGRNTQLAFGAGTERSAGDLTKAAALTGKTFLRELTEEQTGFTLAYALFGAQEPGNSFKHEATELKGGRYRPSLDGCFTPIWARTTRITLVNTAAFGH